MLESENLYIDDPGDSWRREHHSAVVLIEERYHSCVICKYCRLPNAP